MRSQSMEPSVCAGLSESVRIEDYDADTNADAASRRKA